MLEKDVITTKYLAGCKDEGLREEGPPSITFRGGWKQVVVARSLVHSALDSQS